MVNGFAICLVVEFEFAIPVRFAVSEAVPPGEFVDFAFIFVHIPFFLFRFRQPIECAR